MATLSRWLASVAIAAGLGMAALTPTPARADDDLVRVIVDVADVIHRAGQPYYRYGNYGYNDRLIVVRDRYGRPVYYRQVPRSYYSSYGYGPPYGKAHGTGRSSSRRILASPATATAAASPATTIRVTTDATTTIATTTLVTTATTVIAMTATVAIGTAIAGVIAIATD